MIDGKQSNISNLKSVKNLNFGKAITTVERIPIWKQLPISIGKFLWSAFDISTRFLQRLEPWGILAAIIGLWFTFEQMRTENEAREQDRIINAWDMINTPSTGNSGKKEALEFLFESGISLDGLDLSCQKHGGSRSDVVNEIRDMKQQLTDAIKNPDLPDDLLRFKETENLVCNYPIYFTDLDLTADANNARKISRVSFQGAILQNAKFDALEMWDVDFRWADLESASFEYSYIVRSNFSGSKAANFNNSTLLNVNFEPPMATEFSFQNALIHQSNLAYLTMLDVDFFGAEFNSVNFEAGIMRDVDFTSAVFKNVAISGADWRGAKNITQEQLNGTWAWSDDLPKLSEGLRVGKICQSQLKEGINSRIGVPFIVPPC